jgi:hypothetical protein
MSHTCHHPNCKKEVRPEKLACPHHWFQLPKRLQKAVWATYVPGQEISKTPSPEYLEVIAQVQDYWREVSKP